MIRDQFGTRNIHHQVMEMCKLINEMMTPPTQCTASLICYIRYITSLDEVSQLVSLTPLKVLLYLK